VLFSIGTPIDKQSFLMLEFINFLFLRISSSSFAELLAEKGTTLYKSNQILEAKTMIKNKILKNAKLKITTKISGKQWPLNSKMPRKEGVARFGLKRGHDCLAAHLHKRILQQQLSHRASHVLWYL
jgi:hypothetical protein